MLGNVIFAYWQMQEGHLHFYMGEVLPKKLLCTTSTEAFLTFAMNKNLLVCVHQVSNETRKINE